MDALSNTNDLNVSVLGLLPVILAAGILVVIVRFRLWESLGALRCSLPSYFLTLLAAALLLAGIFAFLQPTMSWGGADAYFARAINLIRQGTYGTGTHASALFPPGYSFLLVPLAWLLDGSRWAFFLTNLALLVLAAVFFRWALLRLGYGEGPSTLVSLVLFLYPNRLLSTLLPFSDVPFSLLFLGAFLAMLLARRSEHNVGLLILTGLLAAGAAMVRSSGLVLVLPLLAGFLLPGHDRPGQRWINLSLTLAVACIVLLPWTVRNYTIFDRIVPISNNGGLNLAVGNNLTDPIARNTYIDSLWAEEASWARVGGTEWNEAQRDSFLGELGLRYMREHPVKTLSLGIQRVLFTMAADSYSFGALQTYTNMRTLIFTIMGESLRSASVRLVMRNVWVVFYHLLYAVNNTVYYLLVFLAVYAFVRQTGGTIRTTFLLIAAGVWLMVFITFGMSRYKEPISALLPAVVLLSLRSSHPGHRGEDAPES